METRADITEGAHLGPGEGRSFWVLGGLVTRKVSSEQNGGAYSLFETVTQPQEGVPPHLHHREDEFFYVLDGEFEFFENGRTARGGPGDFFYVPKGNLHAYNNVGEGIGRMLVSQTPGGLHERFFEEIGEATTDTSTPPVSEDPPDMESIAKIAAEYGIEMPSPGRSYNGQEEITE